MLLAQAEAVAAPPTAPRGHGPCGSPGYLPADHQQVVEEEEVNFPEEFLGPQGSGCFGARHLLQLTLLQQPAGVGDDGHRLGGQGHGIRMAVPLQLPPSLSQPHWSANPSNSTRVLYREGGGWSSPGQMQEEQCVCVCVCMKVHAPVYTSVCASVYLSALYVLVSKCIYVHLCLRVCVYVCVFVHVGTCRIKVGARFTGKKRELHVTAQAGQVCRPPRHSCGEAPSIHWLARHVETWGEHRRLSPSSEGAQFLNTGRAQGPSVGMVCSCAHVSKNSPQAPFGLTDA